MNKYIICFTEIKNGKRHVHSEYFRADNEIDAESLVRSKYSGVEIISIELTQ
jgi:hypothetical protein